MHYFMLKYFKFKHGIEAIKPPLLPLIGYLLISTWALPQGDSNIILFMVGFNYKLTLFILMNSLL